jgi:hypothetical protein
MTTTNKAQNEYWKARCEALENYVNVHVGHWPNYSQECEMEKAWAAYQAIKSRPIPQPEPVVKKGLTGEWPSDEEIDKLYPLKPSRFMFKTDDEYNYNQESKRKAAKEMRDHIRSLNIPPVKEIEWEELWYKYTLAFPMKGDYIMKMGQKIFISELIFNWFKQSLSPDTTKQ